MVRNSFSLSAICGGALASSKPISSENAFLLELHSNPVLSDTFYSVMDNPEIKRICADPSIRKEFGSLINRLHPDLIKKLPDILTQCQTLFGDAL